MYYKFNYVTGKLGKVSQMVANLPQGLRILKAIEPIITKPANLKSISESAVSYSSGSKAAPTPPTGSGNFNPNIRRLQEKFQKPDGVVIYLKGGPMDRVLYLSTVGLCVIGTLWCFYTIYDMAVPKKPSD